MASIADQLAAASLAPTDTLKHPALPASWTKLPFRASSGTWSATTGWSPPAAELGGAYYNVAKRSGPSYVLVTEPEGVELAGALLGLWLFAGAASINGYNIQLTFESGSKYKVDFTRWVSEVPIGLGSATVELGPGKGFAIVSTGANKYVYYRPETATVWKPLLAATNSALVEGFSAIDGKNSHPFTNFATGALASVEGAASLALPLSITASGTAPTTKKGAAQILVPLAIGALGKEGRAVRGAASIPSELKIAAAGHSFPSHQKVALNVELAPTRIQYEK